MNAAINENGSPNRSTGGSRVARRLAADRLRIAAEQVESDERQEALRALLMHPILPASGPQADSYRLVWRHAAYLREWLARMAGWTLVLQADLARLRKVPAALDDATRAAIDRTSEQPLTRSRYALVCLVLAVLENEDRQTTLELIARKTQLLASGDVRLKQFGFEFDLTNQDSRRDMVCAIRLLESLRVMSRDDGDDQQFVQGTGDALYRIDRPVLASLLCVSRPPSTLSAMEWSDRLTALHETELPDSDEARNRHIRHQLVRRLLDDPVMYFDQLTEPELEYLTSQRGYILGEITKATGLEAEVRREGIALLDPAGDLTDTGLPEAGTRGHATLLLAEWFAARLRTGESRGVTWSEVDEKMASLVAEYGDHWRKGIGQAAAREALARDVVHRLECLGLASIRRGEIVPRPAIARYAIGGQP
jgi:uncharacterized protein (TIGR02678 family)